ncbi:MAG: hypothetical protein ACI4MP_08435 [Candidatus Ventricola sp.]
MKPSRENVFGVLARLEQAGALPDDGPTSIFVSDRDGPLRLHPTQLAVRVSGDAVFVRISRLPFVRPYVYSRQALRTAGR